MTRPTVVFGLPVFNGEQYLRESLESLLNQSYPNVHVIAVDNASTDSSYRILTEYANDNPRLSVYRNDRNIGQIKNIRRTYWEAMRSFPGAEFFALGSDHDLWHLDWATHLVRVFDEHPDAVLAFPTTVPIDADEKRIGERLPFFHSGGLSRRQRSAIAASRMKGAGVMVYGLFRAVPLGDLGVYPMCVFPDRLLMMELALEGEFIHLDQELFFRRYSAKPPSPTGSHVEDFRMVVSRQRATLFPDRSPWHSHFPISNIVFRLIWDLSLKPGSWRRGLTLYGPIMAFRFARRRKRLIIAEITTFLGRFRPFKDSRNS